MILRPLNHRLHGATHLSFVRQVYHYSGTGLEDIHSDLLHQKHSGFTKCYTGSLSEDTYEPALVRLPCGNPSTVRGYRWQLSRNAFVQNSPTTSVDGQAPYSNLKTGIYQQLPLIKSGPTAMPSVRPHSSRPLIGKA
jgi:hypothetical protein